jgi:hypothetical protein
MSLIQAEFDKFEPLPDDVLKFVEAYHSVMVPKAVRAFYYLLLICTRESRHNQSLHSDKGKIAELFGKNVADFHTSVNGGESSIHQALLSSPPAAPIGEYVKSLQWAFYNSSWSHSFGGPKWGAVADCLVRFVTGEFTAEMMLDTNWTLAHNGGPIFNKGMLYSHYNAHHLQMLLDVQRSGQIPEVIREGTYLKSYVEPDLMVWVNWLQDRYPEKIGKFVDWYTVEALGSIGHYPQQKKVQTDKYGMSEKASKAEQEAAAKAKAMVEQAKKQHEKEAKEKAEFAENHFLVQTLGPGKQLYVKKVKRKAA